LRENQRRVINDAPFFVAFSSPCVEKAGEHALLLPVSRGRQQSPLRRPFSVIRAIRAKGLFGHDQADSNYRRSRFQ
jgi:hypothetical protein